MDQPTPATAADLDAVCALIQAQQRQPDRAIAYLSDEAAAIAEEITAVDRWTERAWVVRSAGVVAGFLMADTDVEIDRVWWMGPFATTTDPARWAETADALYACGRARSTPAGEELAGDDRHRDLSAFARRHGFRAEEASAALRCATPPATLGPPRSATGWTVAELAPGHRGAVAALHDEFFPGTHTTGRGLVERALDQPAGDRFRCLVAIGPSPDGGPDGGPDTGPVLGYVAVEAQADGSGYIDFVGVAPRHRRSGLGRALVSDATNALFERGSSYVHLTVRESNVAARRLYASLGFTEDRLLRPYRRGFTLEPA